MRVCIYGAGAIGGYMAISLKQAGADVSLIARGAHLEAIQANGLKLLIHGEERVERLPASSDPNELGPQDYVIVALKAHQAWEVAEQMHPLFGPDTAVVTAQNGVPWWYFYGMQGLYSDLQLQSVDPGGRQWRAIGPERAIGCTVYPATEIAAPGVVKHIFGDRFGLGEPASQTTSRVTKLSDAMQAGGLQPRIYPDIRNDIWLKLWGNLCFNPLSALTRATLDVVATDPDTRKIAYKMMKEAEQVARKLGVDFRVDIERRIDGAAAVGAHRTSMLQDLEKKRPIELNALLTVVQEMGQLIGISTPTIDIVLSLTRQMGRVAGVYPVFTKPELQSELLSARPNERTASIAGTL
jgi:2-dehydropantoate 2-reductase